MESSNHELIWQIQSHLVKIYKEQELTCLKGIDNNYKLNGRQILTWHSNTIHKGRIKYSNFKFDSNFQDILFCSDEILFFLAQMYLYKPFINNPINDSYKLDKKTIYPNFENLEGFRYSMYAHVVSEKIYNYWDRLGDLLAVYFPAVFTNPKSIFFTTVIDRIPAPYNTSDNYKWLKTYRDGKFYALNEERKNNVHYLTTDRRFKDEHLQNVTDGIAMQQIIDKRYNLTEEYKEHMYLTLEGFEKTMQLIEEITKSTITDLEVEQILQQLSSKNKNPI